jgi:hypothetical protein
VGTRTVAGKFVFGEGMQYILIQPVFLDTFF